MKKAALVRLAVVLTAVTLPASAGSRPSSNLDPPMVSFQAPASYYPGGRTSAGVSKTVFTDAGNPVPFIPLVACRQYDSRDFTPLPDNTLRAVTLSGFPCGISLQAIAVAVNITVFSITGAGGNGVFKAGNVNPPITAWINYPPTETQRGNAGVLPVDTFAVLYVKANQAGGSVAFTVDVFGYYSGIADTQQNTFHFDNSSSNYTMRLANNSTTCSGICGLYQSVESGTAILGQNNGGTTTNFGVMGQVSVPSAAGSAGVSGVSEATVSTSYGVLGVTGSTAFESAGVRGIDAIGAAHLFSFNTSGVRGEGRLGVIGISSIVAGVIGQLNDSTGTQLTSGILGFSSTTAVFGNGDIHATGTISILEPHPTDPTLVIKYVALEGPEAGTYFRGTSQTRNGRAVITVPDSFRIVTAEDGLTTQVTALGRTRIWVDSEQLDQIVVPSDSDVRFHYLVQGFRKAYKDHRDVAATNEYAPRSEGDRMPLSFSAEAKQRLIANGTYNPDGTVNMQTAERLGWAEKWREQAQQAISRAPQKSGQAPQQ